MKGIHPNENVVCFCIFFEETRCFMYSSSSDFPTTVVKKESHFVFENVCSWISYVTIFTIWQLMSTCSAAKSCRIHTHVVIRDHQSRTKYCQFFFTLRQHCLENTCTSLKAGFGCSGNSSVPDCTVWSIGSLKATTRLIFLQED